MPRPEESTDPAHALLIHDRFVRVLARSLLVDRDAADDVVQDTWLSALERGAAAVSLPGWLAGVVRNRARKHARSQERRLRREQVVARGEGAPSDEEILEREAVRARVVAAVLALDEPYRECVLLRFFENLPPRRIAARLGVPVETVRTRLKRALETLRARLDREYDGGRALWSAALLPWAQGSAGAFGPALLGPLALAGGTLALAGWLGLRWLDSSAEEQLVATVATSGATSMSVVQASTTSTTVREPSAEPTALPIVSPTGSLRATVHWSDGTPASGIHGRLHFQLLESPVFHARQGVTDEQGVLRLAELPTGPACLWLDRNSSGAVEIEAGQEATLALTLPRGFDVEGVVVDFEGVPVAGADLWLSDINAFTGSMLGRSGADGRFELRSCTRGQDLGAFAAGHAPSLLAGLDAEEGARVSVRLVLLGAGGEVRGTVRGSAGELVADAQILVGSEMLEFRRTFVPGEGELVGTVAPPQLVRTDSEGRFRVRGVPPGLVPIVVRSEGCALWRSTLTLDAAEPAELAVSLSSEASLSGCVRDEHGNPLARAWVRLSGKFGLLDPSVTTGADGLYRLGGLGQGRNDLEVQVSKAGSARAAFDLAPGKERAWDPVVGLGPALAGRVLDESGAPLRGWSVDAVGETSPERPSFGSARTDADGRFLVKSLADMTYRVTLEAPGSSVAVLELGGVRPGRDELVVRVPASRRPSARVRGRIVEGAGTTPANLALELATANLGIPSEVDAAGAFELAPLVPALYTLRVRAQGHVEHVLGPRRLGADETWDLGVVVLAPAGSLAVRATGAEGLAPWFRVRRTSPDGSFGLGPVEKAGEEWRRAALAAGDYALEVGGHGVAADLVPFTLQPGEERTLEIALRPGLRREIHVRAAPDLGQARVHLRVRSEAGALLVDDELWPSSPGDYRSFGTYAPGSYRVLAELPDGPRVEAELEVTPDTVLPLVLELR